MQTKEILETIKMIDEECLDIRTITMGISLMDCMDPDIHKSCEKIEIKPINLFFSSNISLQKLSFFNISLTFNFFSVILLS